MREFESMADFSTHLVKMVAAEAIALHRGLDKAAQLIENTAKAEIGHYQEAAGPFQDWAQLADSTEAEKARLGYPSDAPLLRTGGLRDSIQHETEGFEAIIGSTDPVMEWQEFGTNTIPPRPVIGPAAFTTQEKVQEILGAAVVNGFVGSDVIHPSLGYDMEIKATK
jgi:phage gpG-like protein